MSSSAKIEHTPTPWKISDTVRENGHIKISGAGPSGLVASVGNGETAPHRFAANAALIVTAVNSHADLVKALKEWVDQGYIDADGEPCGSAAYAPKLYAQSVAALSYPVGREELKVQS